MINSPVLELQGLASSGSIPLIDVLLKAKVISVKLGLDDISQWLEREISGYATMASVPDYRVGHGLVKAFNPYRGWIPVDLGTYDQTVIDMFTTIRFTDDISSLSKISASTSTPYLHLPTPLVEALSQGHDSQYQFAWFFSKTKVEQILATVRYRVLEWALDLEKKGVLGLGLLFTPQEKEAAPLTANYITTINGNVNNTGVIGSGNGDIEQSNSITAGDFNSLEKQLRTWGVSQEDVESLSQAIKDSDVPAGPDNFGGKIGTWIGHMIGKAYSGSLKIAATSAPTLLTNAICHYYGIAV